MDWKGLSFQSVNMLLFQGCLTGEPATSEELSMRGRSDVFPKFPAVSVEVWC